MESRELNESAVVSRYRLKKPVVVAVCLGLLGVTMAVAYGLCSLQLKAERQNILNTQREMQQAWVDKTLEGIRAWHEATTAHVRLMSGAEMVRLYTADMCALEPEERRRLLKGEASGGDEALAALAEQTSYMRDLLRDFVRGRKWLSARIVTDGGDVVLGDSGAASLTVERAELVRQAVAARAMAFGPVRPLAGGLAVDVAAPLEEVLGHGGDAPVGVFLATIPVSGALEDFLANAREVGGDLRTLLVQRGAAGMEAFVPFEGAVKIETAHLDDWGAALPFKLRPAIVGDGHAWAEGRLSEPGWMVVAESPDGAVEALVDRQARRIYGLGILGSLGTALLLAFIWASQVSRSHKATALRFQRLYTLIRRQKRLLDSVNASLQVGLLLMDTEGRVHLCNPAFAQMAGAGQSAIEQGNLTEYLPEEAVAKLFAGMEAVIASGREGSVEISQPKGEEIRLFRVTLFPYEEHSGDAGQGGKGCVGIFQDITEFRRRAEAARQRQASTMGALVRAIESVDANLVGHSLKMERVANLLGGAMNLPDADRETLRLAARLSQVGKIFVPRDLLTKAGKLSPAEQAEVRRAPEYAYGILRDMQFSLPVPEAVYQMGERMNGKGNPRHLSGEAITLNARVLAVVDAFCAMTSARSYRAGMPPEKAIGILRGDDGFDGRVVDALAGINAEALRQAVASENDAPTPGEAG